MSLLEKYKKDLTESLINDFPKYISLSEKFFAEIDEGSSLIERLHAINYLLQAKFYENKFDEAYEFVLDIEGELESIQSQDDTELYNLKYGILIAKASICARLEYIDEEIQIYISIIADASIVFKNIIYNNLAEAFGKINNLEKAKYYIDKAFNYSKTELQKILTEENLKIENYILVFNYNIYHDYVYMLHNKVTIYRKLYMKNGLLDEVIWADSLVNQFNLDKRLIQQNKCEILTDLGRYDEALILSDEIIEKTLKHELVDSLYYDYKIQAEIFIELNDYTNFKTQILKALPLDENVLLMRLLSFYEKCYEFILIHDDLSLLKTLHEKLKNLRSKYIEKVENRTHSKARILFLNKENELKEKQLNELNKLNDKLSIKNKELLRFASVVAHDIKSPVRNIGSMLNIMQDESSSKEDKEKMVSIISKSFSNLTLLVDDLLSFAKSGEYSSEKTVFTVESILHKIQKNFSEEIKAKNVEFKCIGEKTMVLAYEPSFLQIFLNLVSNAILYSSKNRNLKIEIVSKIQNNRFEISFKDNGLGIAKEEQKKIFEPLSRGSNSKHISGTGLGLNTILEIMKYYKGSISLESEVNIGTCFVLSFPESILAKG